MAKIMEWMDAFNVRLCISGWGFGQDRIPELKKKYGNRVQAMFYSPDLGVKLKYDSHKGYWLANRSRVLYDYIAMAHELPRKIVLPGKDMDRLRFVWDNHIAVQSEYRLTKNGKSEQLFYTHASSQPDDGFHGCFYCWIGSIILPPGNITVKFRVVN
jgi:hypothetical protein